MINLIHDYVVDVDQHNYTLMRDKHKRNKKGNPIYETLGYYSSLEGAISAAKQCCIKTHLGKEVYSLHEAIEIIRQVNKEFSDLLKEVLGND